MEIKKTMSEKVTPYKKFTIKQKEQVATMFNTISGNYDSLNRLYLLVSISNGVKSIGFGDKIKPRDDS